MPKKSKKLRPRKKPTPKRKTKKTTKSVLPVVWVEATTNVAPAGDLGGASRALMQHIKSRSKYFNALHKKLGKKEKLDLVESPIVDFGSLGYVTAFTDMDRIIEVVRSKKLHGPGSRAANEGLNLLIKAIREAYRLLVSEEGMTESMQKSYVDVFGTYFDTHWPTTAVYPSSSSGFNTTSLSDDEAVDQIIGAGEVQSRINYSFRQERITRLNKVLKKFLRDKSTLRIKKISHRRYLSNLPPLAEFIELVTIASSSSYSSLFMMLEFGTGIYATPVRPFQNYDTTPHKIPPVSGYIRALFDKVPQQGSWFSYPIFSKSLKTLLDLSQANEQLLKEEQGLYNQLSNLPFNKLVRTGFPGSHVIYTNNRNSLSFNVQFQRLFQQYPKNLQKLLQNKIDRIPLVRQLYTRTKIKILIEVQPSPEKGEIGTQTRLLIQAPGKKPVYGVDLK